MRIVFVGTVAFSRHCLQEVLRHHGDVAAVLTLDPEHGRAHADYADLSEVTAPNRIPLIRITDINDPETERRIRALQPDWLFVFGWSQKLSRTILQIPRRGCIGSHPALLPQHRGRHPIIWALAEGLRESGLTFFHLEERVDSGDILWQRSFPISVDDDAASVYQKVEQLASQAIAEFMPQLAHGDAPRIPQDHRKATYWRKRTEQDGEVHWDRSTLQIYNLIRALTRPYGGAHAYLDGRKLTIWRSRLPEQPLSPRHATQRPGTVLSRADDGLQVRTGDGYLHVIHYDTLEEFPLPPRAHAMVRS